MLKRLVLMLISVSGLTTAACGGGPAEKQQDLKAQCQNFNNLQRAVTAFTGDLQVATSANPNLLNTAQQISTTMTDDLAQGVVSSSTALNDDLAAAAKAIGNVDTDLRAGNLQRAQTDGDALRSAMSQLGMDCSKYLT
ncbi:MAG: hypothetical protein ACREN2_11530 [Candidatus Dormibacteria bacterium]